MTNIILTKVRSILLEPTKFFTKLKEPRIADSFIYMLILLGVNTLGGIIMGMVFPLMLTALLGLSTLPGTLLAMFTAIGYVAQVVLSFLWAGILHIWIRIFGGRATYARTYQLMVYAGTPTMLFGWIPFISLLAGIWSLILMMIGTTKTHKISMKKSILLYVIPILAGMILMVVLISVIMGLIMSMAQSGQLR